MHSGKLVIISGPSGIGKDTLLSMLLNKHQDWQHPPSTTTRTPRPGESREDMQFISTEEFEKLRSEGAFLETVQVYGHHWYGTLKEPVLQALQKGSNVVLRVDVLGALKIKEIVPEAILIFIRPENWEVLEKRIRKRGSVDEAAIKARLERARRELPYQDKYDFVITNYDNKQEQALAQIEKAINS